MGLRDERALGAVEIAHEGLEAAFVIEHLGSHLGAARVGQFDANAGIQEGEFAQPVLDGAEIIIDHGEGRGRGEKGDLRAAFGLAVDERRGPRDFERRDRVAMREADEMLLAVAPDPELQPGRRAR